MGEVYRARDRRLGRDVAIKVLTFVTSANSERVKRFEREARAAFSLNHPNIVTIYDFGSEDSVSYIAMEWVEGTRLRDLLERPLETRRLLDIAVQMAGALAKAHAAGICSATSSRKTSRLVGKASMIPIASRLFLLGRTRGRSCPASRRKSAALDKRSAPRHSLCLRQSRGRAAV